MIRVSEMVLPGHPDKFCDQIADAVIAEAVRVDRDAYGQVEVATWSDRVWLNGGICTQKPLKKSLREIVVETGQSIGYVPGNHIDANKYVVDSSVCLLVDDPSRWTRHVNDQAIVIGWAGYDAQTHYLPPEHFLAHIFRDALVESCRTGPLAGHGPDGKLLVRVREEADRWWLEHVLVTIQQMPSAALLDVCQAVSEAIRQAYEALQERDGRWSASWDEVELSLNPNGPLLNGGSGGDNGQTGRKLAADFYGPRVPIGGGALSGKHMSHIDRIGSYAARDAAVRAVANGAKECLVRLCYAPNNSEPLDITFEMIGRAGQQPPPFFEHRAMVARYPPYLITAAMGYGTHFFDPELPWNGAPPHSHGKGTDRRTVQRQTRHPRA